MFLAFALESPSRAADGVFNQTAAGTYDWNTSANSEGATITWGGMGTTLIQILEGLAITNTTPARNVDFDARLDWCGFS